MTLHFIQNVKPRPAWVHGLRPGLPPTFFPAGWDTSDLIEITAVEDRWAKFIHARSGQIVDCATFAALAEEEQQDRHLDDSHGFTLTEFLIVLAIVGILLAVALDAFQKNTGFCFTYLNC